MTAAVAFSVDIGPCECCGEGVPFGGCSNEHVVIPPTTIPLQLTVHFSATGYLNEFGFPTCDSALVDHSIVLTWQGIPGFGDSWVGTIVLPGEYPGTDPVTYTFQFIIDDMDGGGICLAEFRCWCGDIQGVGTQPCVLLSASPITVASDYFGTPAGGAVTNNVLNEGCKVCSCDEPGCPCPDFICRYHFTITE